MALEVPETTVWIPKEVLSVCTAEASRTFPLETGGTFMGWWASIDTVVITAVIGPGPKADHGRFHFQPDQAWQLDQIARHYKATSGGETYLGDWHSHPRAATGLLSHTDKRVLRRIISFAKARCPIPVMGIWWGEPESWLTTIWRAEWSGAFLRKRVETEVCRKKIY